VLLQKGDQKSKKRQKGVLEKEEEGKVLDFFESPSGSSTRKVSRTKHQRE